MARKVRLPKKVWKTVVSALEFYKINTKRQREIAKADEAINTIRTTLGFEVPVPKVAEAPVETPAAPAAPVKAAKTKKTKVTA